MPRRTSCSSPSTRCAPTRCRRTAGRRRRRTSIGWPSHGARFTFAHAHAVVTLPSHTIDPHRPAALRARHARQQRLPRPAGHADAGDAPQGARLRDRRLRRRLSADQALRPDARLRRLRRPDARDARRDRGRRCRSAAPTSSCRARVDWIGQQQSAVLRAGCTSSTRTRPTSRPTISRAQYGAQPYYGEVAFVDRALGPLFDRLATLPRPTLVIVTADHGESLGEHGELTHGMFAYEATLHVPLIVARVDAGRAAAARRRRHRRAGPPHRHRRRPCSTRSARRPIATLPGDRRCAPVIARRRARDRPDVFRVDDLQPGARLGAAARRARGARRSTSTCRSPSCTTWPPIRRKRSNLAAGAARSRRRC